MSEAGVQKLVARPIRTRDSIIEDELRARAGDVEELLDANLVSYLGPINDEIGVASLKSVLEAIEDEGRKPRLVVNFETNGGYVESAERMAGIMRHHYDKVDFVVTTHAMSAGTVLVMSGDRIWMDYSATLGPIDPQIEAPDGSWLPALGYLEQYERLVDKSRQGNLTDAELAFMLEHFDPAELYMYEQARALSVALVKEWLVQYKFRDWKTTKTRKVRVTEKMRKDRAETIAQMLNDTRHWHSHGRGISKEVVERELLLQIEDLDEPSDERAGLRDALVQYNKALFDYKALRGHDIYVIDSAEGYYGG
jgi:Serine dehydrogenase proteinase